MMRYLFIILLLSLLYICATFAGQTGSMQTAATPGDSLNIQTKHGDVNRDGCIDIYDLISILRQFSGAEPETAFSDLDNNGKTNVFDLLAFLHAFTHLKERQEENFEVAASVGGHWLTEPVVYSFSRFDENNEVRDTYKIYSNREIERVEFVFAGDTLTQTEGTTPAFFQADPDTIQWIEDSLHIFSEPREWKITVWDKEGNCAADSGVSAFQVLRPDVVVDGGYGNTGKEIEFPLTLKGAWQRVGITVDIVGEVDTFVVDLNPEGCDSIVYENIDQLSGYIMEAVASNDSLWPVTNEVGEGPVLFISSAIYYHTGLKSNRLIIVITSFSGEIKAVSLDGNEKLLSVLGFRKWIQDIPGRITDLNYRLDPEMRELYESR